MSDSPLHSSVLAPALLVTPGHGHNVFGGARLRSAMPGFVRELGKAIVAGFEGDAYRSRLAASQRQYQQREDDPMALAAGHLIGELKESFAAPPKCRRSCRKCCRTWPPWLVQRSSRRCPAPGRPNDISRA